MLRCGSRFEVGLRQERPSQRIRGSRGGRGSRFAVGAPSLLGAGE